MNFISFYQTYFEQLSRMASCYLGSEDAEDVVQDVLATLWERREGLVFVDDMKSYVFSSVKHRCLDWLKHENYKHEYCRRTLAGLHSALLMEMQSNHSSTSQYVEYNEMVQRVDMAISRLPNRCREIFLLSRKDGLRYNEIATRLGISQNTVECQMTIALKKLRQLLRVS